MKKEIKIIIVLVILIILAFIFKSQLREFGIQLTNDTTNKYDNITEIIVSGEGCYGECEVYDLLLKKNGDVMFRSGNFSKNKGLFASAISPKKFDTLLAYVEKSNILNKNNILGISADDYQHSLSLISNDEIMASYYYCPTDETMIYDSIFIYAKRLKQELGTLRKISFQKSFLNHAYIQSYSRNDRSLELYNSDSFFLLTKFDEFEFSNNGPNNYKTKLDLDLWSQYADLNLKIIHPIEFILSAPYEKDTNATINEYESELRKYPNFPKSIEYEYPYLKFLLNSGDENILKCRNKIETYLKQN